MKRSKHSFHDFSAKHTPSATLTHIIIILHLFTHFPTIMLNEYIFAKSCSNDSLYACTRKMSVLTSITHQTQILFCFVLLLCFVRDNQIHTFVNDDRNKKVINGPLMAQQVYILRWITSFRPNVKMMMDDGFWLELDYGRWNISKT